MTHTKRAPERGAIAVLMALVLTVVMGFAAMAFDLSYVRLARFEMKNATDAAAHAAMYVLRATKGQPTSQSQARTAAETIAGKNKVLGYAVTLTDSDVVFGTWDFPGGTFSASATANAVQVHGHDTADTAPADGTVNTTLGRAIGFASANIDQTSVSAYRPRTTVFEMDITGSFECNLDTAIVADLAFLTDMCSTGVTLDKIGLGIFTGAAKTVTALTPLSAGNCASLNLTWKGDGTPPLGTSIEKHAHQNGIGMCTKAGVRPDGDDICYNCPTCWPNQDNIAGVANLGCADGDATIVLGGVTTPVYSAALKTWGGTSLGAAIKNGIDMLAGTGGRTYDIQSIVIFTDGAPSCCEAIDGAFTCTATGHPAGCCADGTDPACLDNTPGQTACACAKNVALYGTQEANAAGNLGIDLYVLAFARPGTLPATSAAWFAYANSLRQGRGKDLVLNTTDPLALQAQLQQIADNIPISLAR